MSPGLDQIWIPFEYYKALTFPGKQKTGRIHGPFSQPAGLAVSEHLGYWCQRETC